MVRHKQTQPPIPDGILEVSIEELRRTLDWLSASYDKIKAKTLTFMGGGLALMVFLYSSGDVFFPSELYGRIFYIIGFALVVSALVMLFASMLPRKWEFSIDSDDLEDLNFVDKEHYLQYVKNNYMYAYKCNLKTYEKNHKMLTLSFYPLIIGAIILVVLKTFGT